MTGNKLKICDSVSPSKQLNLFVAFQQWKVVHSIHTSGPRAVWLERESFYKDQKENVDSWTHVWHMASETIGRGIWINMPIGLVCQTVLQHRTRFLLNTNCIFHCQSRARAVAWVTVAMPTLVNL